MTANGAILIPSPIPQTATPGEKEVYRLLRQQLPPDYVAWYELALSFRRQCLYPDFIIIGPDQGIVVLEVKGWVLDDISQVRKTLFVLRSGQRQLREHDPFKQARENVLLVKDILEGSNNPALVHTSGPHQGKLRFPYRHAVVLTNLTRAAVARVDGLPQILENEPVFLKDDLHGDFVEQLFALPLKFTAPMSASQLDAIRWVLYPEVRIESKPGKVLDLKQDNAVKSHLSEEAERALGDPLTRLVRGPAGSGKSLVLIKRATFESASNPNWRVLVLTYNRQLVRYLEYLTGTNSKAQAELHNLETTNFHSWCRKALESIGQWQSPIEDKQRRPLICEAIERARMNLNLPEEFVAEEICWMKENELVSWDAYKDADRGGRGIGLAESTRAKVFQIFETYRGLLDERIDWEDIPLRVLHAMEEHLIAKGCYEAIFVDEAQDFAPSWFHVIKLLVNPSTSVLFLAADCTQRIYQRGFSWKKLGLNVKGRTFVLTERYRNPPAVQQLAYDLIKGDEELEWQLEDAGEELIEPQFADDIDFSSIAFQGFRNTEAEYQYMAGQIHKLLEQGHRHSGIAVLHRYRWGVDEVGQYLQRSGLPTAVITDRDIEFSGDKVNICTFHSSKGLEFPVVFLCGLDRINYGLRFAPQGKEIRELWIANWLAEEKKLLYVGMTRSTERLYLTYHSLLPAFVSDLEQSYRNRLQL